MSAEPGMMIYGVSSPYAWDVVESCRRKGLAVRCVDNFGGADQALPGLIGAEGLSLKAETPTAAGLSSPEGRYGAVQDAVRRGYRNFSALVDPTSSVASTAKLGHGVFINAGAVVASNAVLSCHAHVNRSASIGHDAVLGAFASIGPGAILTGKVTVGPGAFVGAGAVVLPNVRIGEGAVVGAGAVVTKDVAVGETVAGNPARTVSEARPGRPAFLCPLC